MNTKKTLALILGLLMMLPMFAACASGDDSGAADDTTSAAEVTEAETTVAETSEYTAPGSNYDGAEVTLAVIDYVSSGTASNWVASSYCEGFMPEQNGDPLNDAIYERNATVEEELGVKIDIFSLSSFNNAGNELRTPILAGEDIVDFALMNGGNLPTFMGTDYIINLNETDLDFSYSWWDQGSVEEFTLFDKLYCATGDISLNAAYAPITIFFNKALVEDFSLDNPYQLVYDGAWTIDASMEMSKTVATDLNGNGEVDISDRFGMLFEGSTLTQMVLSTGERFTTRDSEGVPQPAINTERVSDVLDKFIPFMQDKQTNMLAGNYNGMGYKNVFTDLMLPIFIDDRGLFYNNQLLVALNLRNMEADFGVLPTPKLDEEQEEYYTPYSNHWATFLIIPVTNTQLDMTTEVIQSMGYWSQQLVISAYIDVTVMDKALRDEDSVEMLDIILNNRVYDVGQIFSWGLTGVISMANTNLASTYASKEASILANMEKTIDLLQ